MRGQRPERIFPHGLKRNHPADTLIQDFWPPELRLSISMVYPQFVVLCYSNPTNEYRRDGTKLTGPGCPGGVSTNIFGAANMLIYCEQTRSSCFLYSPAICKVFFLVVLMNDSALGRTTTLTPVQHPLGVSTGWEGVGGRINPSPQ